MFFVIEALLTLTIFMDINEFMRVCNHTLNKYACKST